MRPLLVPAVLYTTRERPRTVSHAGRWPNPREAGHRETVIQRLGLGSGAVSPRCSSRKRKLTILREPRAFLLRGAVQTAVSVAVPDRASVLNVLSRRGRAKTPHASRYQA